MSALMSSGIVDSSAPIDSPSVAVPTELPTPTLSGEEEAHSECFGMDTSMKPLPQPHGFPLPKSSGILFPAPGVVNGYGTPHPLGVNAVNAWPNPWRAMPNPRAPGPPPSAALSCPHCGNVYAGDSRFCRKCGKPRAMGAAKLGLVPGQIALAPPQTGLRLSKSTGHLQKEMTQHVVSRQASGAGVVTRQASGPTTACCVQRPMPLVREVVELATSAAAPSVVTSPLAERRRKRTAKHFAKPMVQWKESIREVPATTVREQLQEVPLKNLVEVVKEVPRPELQRIERTVEVPTIQLQELELREVVRQVPKVEVKYVEKKVPKQVIQYVERTVEVPQVIYEEVIVEVPEVEVKELVRQVPVPVVQYIEKPIPKRSLRAVEKVVHVPQVLHEEQVVEVPQAMGLLASFNWKFEGLMGMVEVCVQVPKAHYTEVPKEFPKVVLEPREVAVEVPVLVREERPVEVPQVQAVQLVRQRLCPTSQTVDKPVPFIQTQVKEKQVQVPVLLQEEAITEVPQQQVVEIKREDLQPIAEEVVKKVPRYEVTYVEKVVEVQSQDAAGTVPTMMPLPTEPAPTATIPTRTRESREEPQKSHGEEPTDLPIFAERLTAAAKKAKVSQTRPEVEDAPKSPTEMPQFESERRPVKDSAFRLPSPTESRMKVI
eukprot:g21774.t1